MLLGFVALCYFNTDSAEIGAVFPEFYIIRRCVPESTGRIGCAVKSADCCLFVCFFRHLCQPKTFAVLKICKICALRCPVVVCAVIKLFSAFCGKLERIHNIYKFHTAEILLYSFKILLVKVILVVIRQLIAHNIAGARNNHKVGIKTGIFCKIGKNLKIAFQIVLSVKRVVDKVIILAGIHAVRAVSAGV